MINVPETLRVSRSKDNSYVKLNVLNHNKGDFGNEENIYLYFNGTVYPSLAADDFLKGTLGINTFVRTHLRLALNDIVSIKLHSPIQKQIKQLDLRIVSHGNNKSDISTVHVEDLREHFVKNFENFYLYTNQCLYYEVKNLKLVAYITNKAVGYICKETQINIVSDDTSLNVVGSQLLKRELFKDDYNFEELGIGGLNKELISILRRCLSTRAYKPEIVEKLGIKHVKGMLLYGPPGTGKTLIARKIGSIITDKKPKIVNGPEIMNKYVGQSEENIRNLFSEAINDTDQSSLHVIIFDEIDAICKTRGRGGGSGSSNVNDSIVNQLLTMIDGYNSLNNIFVIGMTNRKDLLDDALIRAGRLEVHVEIGLPDKEGREHIFRIHTNNMKTNNMLGDDVIISELALITENYSGAEIEGVVKNAGGRALHEDLINTKEKQEENDRAIVVHKKHFIDAIGEVIPAFGSIVKQTMNLIPKVS